MKRTGLPTPISQFLIVFWKLFMVQKQHLFLLAIEVFLPALSAVGIFFLLDRSTFVPSITHPDATSIAEIIPRAKGSAYTLLYAPTTDVLSNALIERVAHLYSDPLKMANYTTEDALPSGDILGFEYKDDLDQFILDHEDLVPYGGLTFPPGQNMSDHTYSINVMYNSRSSDGQLSNRILAMAHRALLAELPGQLGGSPKPVDHIVPGLIPSVRPYPSLSVFTPPIENADADGLPLFLTVAALFTFVMTVYSIVQEKQYKLRQMMHVSGLRDLPYWLANFTFHLIWAFIAVLLLLVTAIILDLPTIRHCNILISFTLLFLFFACNIVAAFLFSTFFAQTRTAIGGLALVFLASIMGMMVVSMYLDVIYEPNNFLLAWASSLFFPVNLSKAFDTITKLCHSSQKEPGDPVRPPVGFSLIDAVHFGSIPVIEQLLWLAADFIIYSILCWYLDNVTASARGVGRSLFFPFTLDYWGFKSPQPTKEYSPAEADKIIGEGVDNDVRKEMKDVILNRLPDTNAIRIVGLKKTFKSLGRKNVAVNGLSLAINENTICGLLGHNGAGKTTLINMLTGQMKPSGGFARIFGNDIVAHKDRLHTVLGLCPQFDVLWPELSAAEHLRIFAHLKEIPRGERDEAITQSLRSVHLNNVRSRKVGRFSGGMRRRLTLTMALLGNPQLVILDEPTTGLDVINRRRTWETILGHREGRVFLLTTHSMEEADTLSDKIAIMADGRLRAVGTSLRLKQRYGVGARVFVTLDITTLRRAREHLREMFTRLVPGSRLVGRNGPHHTMYVPRRQLEKLPDLCEALEAPSQFVRDFSVASTSLEDVFMVTGKKGTGVEKER
ncbi:ABC transporter [Carpediemonas membranifera]|uniref:ABC transporter n=1 Tax=Carpediemonas membranifera TaxID=201153 RepID=A0A8J6E2U9_9EUKA|nr:ABC transporter [Carpediemonas membranifera]|eukprot:KAG9392332.1 ABC transporter [Carpediemonas membranifera]